MSDLRRIAPAAPLAPPAKEAPVTHGDILLLSTGAGLLIWDAATDTTTHSERFLAMLGYDADGPHIPPLHELVHPDERERSRAHFLAQIRSRDIKSGLRQYEVTEFRVMRTDGRYIWVQAQGIGVCDANGKTQRFISSIMDISSIKATEEALAHEREALRQSRDQIAAQAAQLERQNEALKENVRLREEVERMGRHDIKTPLNSIIAVPRLLREQRNLSADQEELLGIVERAGYRILSMVNLSLDLFKMENGSYAFRPDAVDLQDLVAKVWADLQAQAASKGVTLEMDTGPGAAALAWAEELLCYSLLANLLKNAVEASPAGQAIHVALACEGGQVQVCIHNAGDVPLALRDNFFQKYATLGKASGTGLGTYSARLMARVQEGDIQMQTGQGGTTLIVRLKAAPAGQQPAVARHLADGEASAQPLADLPPRHVLLVDDDEYNLLIVRRYLPSPPLSVATAINGLVALERAREHWPDLIVMDLDMPILGGLQAVGRLRALQREQALGPCHMVALSSHDDAATQHSALAAGFDGYLVKPVTRSAIDGLLSSLFAASAAAPTAIDADLLALLPAFIASRRVLVADLARAASDGHSGEVRRLAHLMAGSFGQYGFADCADVCRQLEHQEMPASGPAFNSAMALLTSRLDSAAAMI